MMKVLYVSAKYGLHDYRFLKKLAEDYDVLFLHYSSNKNIPVEAGELKNLPVIARKPLVKSFPLASDLFYFKKLCRQFKPDIIHTGYVWQVGILPAMLNLHPHLSMVWGSDVLTEPDKSMLKKMLVKKVMRTADHIQCDAEFVKKKIIDDYAVSPDKITVFPWGIDLASFYQRDQAECREKLKLDKNKFTILFSRPLENVYDIPTLMNGLKIFCEGKDDVQAVIAHDGSQKTFVLDFIKANKLENKIKITGWINYADVPLLYSAADVFVSTALSDGTPLSLLEAMACGMGLVVTGIPSVKEWVSDENGFVIPTGNPGELSIALNKYYSNRLLIKSHGARNVEIAKEKADWDKNYMKLREIYDKIASK